MRIWLGFLGSLLVIGATDTLGYHNGLLSSVRITKMIRVVKEYITEKLSELKDTLNWIFKNEEEVYIDVLTKEQYLNAKQNRTFHALLDCFWKSGCSSFATKQDMKFYYKRQIGLIEVMYNNSNLTEETKQMVWKAIKLLPLEFGQRSELCDLLKGRVLKEHSWSEAKKQRATEAIDNILHDMDTAGVIGSKMGKKYEEILRGINEDNFRE